jgi:hypothetical protein
VNDLQVDGCLAARIDVSTQTEFPGSQHWTRPLFDVGGFASNSHAYWLHTHDVRIPLLLSWRTTAAAVASSTSLPPSRLKAPTKRNTMGESMSYNVRGAAEIGMILM